MKFDLQFLEMVCSSPWTAVDVGGVVKTDCHENSILANHVHVDCPTPFLIAATSMDTSSGEEHFGLAVITNQQLMERFLQGPYPPHNRPRVLSLEQVTGRPVADFLKEPKEFSLLHKAVETLDGLGTPVSITHGLKITSRVIDLSICADDETPMGIRLSW
jgi:hypothetical protein